MLPAMPQAITQPIDRAASGLPSTLAAKAGAHRAPANAITTSEGIGMHMEPSIISTNTARYPLSAISRWTVSVKTASRGNTFRLTSGNARSVPTAPNGPGRAVPRPFAGSVVPSGPEASIRPSAAAR